PEGELALTDVSILLPQYDQVYGSFCQWNPTFQSRSPGLFACLLAARWAAENNYPYYNLGPVGDYEYKSLFVTHHEPIYSLALTYPHPRLPHTPPSPLHPDSSCGNWNRVYRNSKPMPMPLRAPDAAAE